MVLQNFYKLIIYLDKKYSYYGSDIDYLDFNEKLKHEIIWKKPDKKFPVKDVAEQRKLF